MIRPVGDCPVGDCLVGDCPVGECPVGECPVGECPCTIVWQVDNMILYDGNYDWVHGMDSVHYREPERSRVTI